MEKRNTLEQLLEQRQTQEKMSRVSLVPWLLYLENTFGKLTLSCVHCVCTCRAKFFKDQSNLA